MLLEKPLDALVKFKATNIQQTCQALVSIRLFQRMVSSQNNNNILCNRAPKRIYTGPWLTFLLTVMNS